MKLWIGLLLFVVGVGLGLSLPRLAPQSVHSYLPGSLQGTHEKVTGVVVRKQREADRLLLTISTQQGALLATFKKHITEIDLLVDEKDSVTLGVNQYEPFITDPVIKSVMKPHNNNVDELGAKPEASTTAPMEQPVVDQQETVSPMGETLP